MPVYMGETFVMLSKFWVIVAKFARVYYQDTQIPFKDRVTLPFAEEIYQELLHWMDTVLAQAKEDLPQTHHVRVLSSCCTSLRRQQSTWRTIGFGLLIMSLTLVRNVQQQVNH